MSSKSRSAQSCLTLSNPLDYSPPGSSVHGILQARIQEWVALPSSRGSSQPRDWTRVSCFAGRFFTVWVTREAESKSESEVAQSCPTLCDPMDCKSAGVDCHFLLQGIFPTQESNPGLPHCGQSLYRLSHQGSLTRDQIHIPCFGRQIPNHWTTREVPILTIFKCRVH